MRLNLCIDYSVRDADRKAPPPNAAGSNVMLTDFLITQAIASRYHPAGVKRPADRRIAGKIHNALSRALGAGETSIDLSGQQLAWLKQVLADWAVPSNFAGWYVDLCDTIEAALAEGEDGEERDAGVPGVEFKAL